MLGRVGLMLSSLGSRTARAFPPGLCFSQHMCLTLDMYVCAQGWRGLAGCWPRNGWTGRWNHDHETPRRRHVPRTRTEDGMLGTRIARASAPASPTSSPHGSGCGTRSSAAAAAPALAAAGAAARSLHRARCAPPAPVRHPTARRTHSRRRRGKGFFPPSPSWGSRKATPPAVVASLTGSPFTR